METMTFEEYVERLQTEQGLNDFPKDWERAVTVCPSCKTAQTTLDLIEAGAGKNLSDVEGFIAFSCVGRWSEDMGCDWTLGGLLSIHEVLIKDEELTRPMFRVATKEEADEYWKRRAQDSSKERV